MCRMMAVIGKDIPLRQLARKFAKLAEIGQIPLETAPGHHDGWGIGLFPDFHPDSIRFVLAKSAGNVYHEYRYPSSGTI